MDHNEVPLTPQGELRILFDKENGNITVVSACGNKIVFNDSKNEITISDINTNTIFMSSDGISISSGKSISIHSDQSVSITGNAGVHVEASSGDVSIKAHNIKEFAHIHYSAKSSVSAEVSGGANLTLKGAMVMIN